MAENNTATLLQLARHHIAAEEEYGDVNLLTRLLAQLYFTGRAAAQTYRSASCLWSRKRRLSGGGDEISY